MIRWAIARASEPSSWAGLAGLAVVFGLTETEWASISHAIAAVAAVVSMFVGERV
jgi:hypothetical protein